jgi:hypothetical protein
MREAVLAGHTSNHIHAYAAMRLSHVQPPFVVSLSSFISLCHEGVSRFRHLFFPTVLVIIFSLPPLLSLFRPRLAASQLFSILYSLAPYVIALISRFFFVYFLYYYYHSVFLSLPAIRRSAVPRQTPFTLSPLSFFSALLR